MLSLADYLGTFRTVNDDWHVYLSHTAELIDDAFSPGDSSTTNIQPLVNGFEIMQRLNLKPGKQIGEMLDLIMEAQASGDISTAEQALQLAEKATGPREPISIRSSGSGEGTQSAYLPLLRHVI